jgi:site-specific recombinase XerD
MTEEERPEGKHWRALRRLHREQTPKSPFVFTSERGGPFTTAGFARIMAAATRRPGLKIKAHPHMLRRCLRL